MPSPRGLVQQFDEHLHRSRLLAPKSRLLAAVSGGADSVALLRLLCAVNAGKHWRFTIVAGHVNHRTRGRESDGDEKFVRKLAGELNVKFLSRRLRAMKKPSEAKLRAGRMAALAAMARAAGCDCVVLAHHANDQAETVLMRILRGTSLHGLAGIARESEAGVKMVRPLLAFEGAALRAYLKQTGQRWREDSSNRSLDYLRNRIRHNVMPLLEVLQPRSQMALVRLARHAEEASAVLRELAAGAAASAELRLTKNRAVMNRAPLKTAMRVVLGVLFHGVIEKIGGRLAELSAERIDAAIRAATGEHGKKTVQLGGGVTMEVKGPQVVFTAAKAR